jgi:hypothetical protein
MVDVVQLVRMSDCGSEGRGFESHLPPKQKRLERSDSLIFFMSDKSLLLEANKKSKADPGERRDSLFCLKYLLQELSFYQRQKIIPY